VNYKIKYVEAPDKTFTNAKIDWKLNLMFTTSALTNKRTYFFLDRLEITEIQEI